MIEVGGQQVGVFLGPEDGLMVADRIRRAADILLEIGEDEPETVMDREYRLPGPMRPGGDENG